MIFTAPLLNLYLRRGIIDGFTQPYAVTVFGGSQPTASTIANSWSSYNTTFLQHWVGMNWNHPNATTLNAGNYIELTAIPTATTANANGVATWGIIWANNVSQANVQLSTLPNTLFIVGPVTDPYGTGMIKVPNTTIVAGTTSSLTDVVLTLSLS